jgi:hypothetical protein
MTYVIEVGTSADLELRRRAASEGKTPEEVAAAMVNAVTPQSEVEREAIAERVANFQSVMEEARLMWGHLPSLPLEATSIDARYPDE